MKPTPAEALPKLGLQLLLDHAVALGETYRGSELTVLGSLMFICAEAAADGGLRTRNEIADLRQLLTAAQSELPEANAELARQLGQSLAKADLPTEEADSASLQQQLHPLRQALIAYHAWVEQTLGLDSPQNKAIWALLAQHHAASRIQSIKLMAQMRAQTD